MPFARNHGRNTSNINNIHHYTAAATHNHRLSQPKHRYRGAGDGADQLIPPKNAGGGSFVGEMGKEEQNN
jgi:hypothetical protein